MFDDPLAMHGPDVPQPEVKGNCRLTKAWESPSISKGIWQVATGDPDGDGKVDIIVPDYTLANATLFDFEMDGDNSLRKAWVSPSKGNGVHMAVEIGDLDGDGRGEIIAGQYSFELQVFENSGADNTYTEWPPFPSLGGDISIHELTFRDLEVADTNGDGSQDLIVVQSSSLFPSLGAVSIVSKDGRLLYAWFTDRYFAEVKTGYFDDDDHLDIFITHGGTGRGPFYLDWIEFTGIGYYRRKIEFVGTGLPTAATVADIDGNGRNELMVAGVYEGLRQLLVLESDGDNRARVRDQLAFLSTTNPMDVDVGYVWDGEFPEIAVATHSSGGIAQLFFFRYDGSKVVPVCHTGSELPDSQYAFRTVDLTFVDGDGKADIVLGLQARKALVLEAGTEVRELITDIEVDGSDESARVGSDSPVAVSADVRPRSPMDGTMEVWLVAEREMPLENAYYSFQKSGRWVPGIVPAHTGKIADMGPTELMTPPAPGPGNYIFWLCADMDPDGDMDKESLRCDSVNVEILP